MREMRKSRPASNDPQAPMARGFSRALQVVSRERSIEASTATDSGPNTLAGEGDSRIQEKPDALIQNLAIQIPGKV